MTKHLLPALAVASLCVAAVAGAATTWSRPGTAPLNYVASLGTSTTPDEGAPTLAADGFDVEANKPYLLTVKANPGTHQTGYTAGDVGVFVSSYLGDGGCILSKHDGGCLYPTDDDSGVATSTPPTTVFFGGELRAYRYNPASKTWGRAPAFDVFVEAGLTEQTFSITAPPAPVGRIAYTTTGIGVPTKIYLTALSR